MYLFLDESGNWTFSRKGSEYLVFVGLTIKDPFILSRELEQLKYRLINEGYDIAYFHASEDKQYVRDQVYNVLKKRELDYTVDVVYFNKAKANPSLYDDPTKPKLYLKVYSNLLKYVFNRHDINHINIFTDEIPHRKWREAVNKGLKISIGSNLKEGATFVISHHSSKTNFCLQAADYFSWAVYRSMGDWGDEEKRPFIEIKDKIVSRYDLFLYSNGTKYY